MIFAPLYGLDKRGKERFWQISVCDNMFFVIHGLVGGKETRSDRVFSGNTRISPDEQAKAEAIKKWYNQHQKGYSAKTKGGIEMYNKMVKESELSGGAGTNIVAAVGGAQMKNLAIRSTFMVEKVTVPIKPMKSNKWEYQPRVEKYFDFAKGVYIQPKLDGYRCIARQNSSDKNSPVVMTTNNLKQYPWFGKIREEIKQLGNYLNGLDGELYAHVLYDEDGNEYPEEEKFGLIQSICAVSRTEPHILENQIKFFIFDVVDLSGKYDQKARLKILNKLFENQKFNYLNLVYTTCIKDLSDIEQIMCECESQGYEGIMFRDSSLLYQEGKRALKLRKYKNFVDEEFLIVDAGYDKGVSIEHFVWIVEIFVPNKNGQKIRKTFKVKPRGTREQKKIWFDTRNEFIGKLLTVEFQEKSGLGIPRFPIGKAIRDESDYAP